MTLSRLVVTPEHVTIALMPASLASRVAAGICDVILSSMLGGGMASLANWLLPSAIAPAFAITAGFAAWWLYPVVFEMAWRGQTPGKHFFHLRTVDDRGLPLALTQCLVRSVVRLVDLLPGCGGLGLLVAWCDPWRRRLGDLAAGTMVVDERPVALPPPGMDLTLRHSSLDTPMLRHRVQHRLGLEDRELLLALLLRAATLTATARYDLMEQTGAFLRKRLEIEPIEGLSGEAWVRGIAALCWRSSAPAIRRHPATTT
jgi:uncharacterized RDD family membrane protein YckC